MGAGLGAGTIVVYAEVSSHEGKEAEALLAALAVMAFYVAIAVVLFQTHFREACIQLTLAYGLLVAGGVLGSCLRPRLNKKISIEERIEELGQQGV